LLSFFPDNEQAIAANIYSEMIETAFDRGRHVILGRQFQRSGSLSRNHLRA
jgi:hypothetical protein